MRERAREKEKERERFPSLGNAKFLAIALTDQICIFKLQNHVSNQTNLVEVGT